MFDCLAEVTLIIRWFVDLCKHLFGVIEARAHADPLRVVYVHCDVLRFQLRSLQSAWCVQRAEKLLTGVLYLSVAAGLFLFIALLWLTCAAVDAATIGSYGWQIGVVLGALITTALLWLAFHDSAVGKCLLSLVGFVVLSTAFILGMPIFTDALNSGWYLPLILPLLALPLVISAFWWISAPTAAGRAVLDHIAGFRQYLSIAEAERLDRPREAVEAVGQLAPIDEPVT